MSRSLKKGFFIDHHLLRKKFSDQMASNGSNRVIKTWSRRSTDHSGDGRSDDRRPQRTEVHPGFHLARTWLVTSWASSHMTRTFSVACRWQAREDGFGRSLGGTGYGSRDVRERMRSQR